MRNKKITEEVDSSLYSGEALNLAASIFYDEAEIKITAKSGYNKIDVGAAGNIFGEFLNEALNQQCRIDLAKKNSNISRIIVTRALLSALGEK
ncbi:MAG: hypothetical protein HY746_01845 [Elusimicrobia bacterium]|nr:hypothetical protein [Elusimicrobiota bacterium]